MPVIAIDGRVLEENKDFVLTKHNNGMVEIYFTEIHINLKIYPPQERSILLIGEKKDWPIFMINDKPVMPLNVFSHIDGKFTGVTIRFGFDAPFQRLQLIPKVMDKKTERYLEKKEYEKNHPRAF